MARSTRLRSVSTELTAFQAAAGKRIQQSNKRRRKSGEVANTVFFSTLRLDRILNMVLEIHKMKRGVSKTMLVADVLALWAGYATDLRQSIYTDLLPPGARLPDVPERWPGYLASLGFAPALSGQDPIEPPSVPEKPPAAIVKGPYTEYECDKGTCAGRRFYVLTQEPDADFPLCPYCGSRKDVLYRKPVDFPPRHERALPKPSESPADRPTPPLAAATHVEQLQSTPAESQAALIEAHDLALARAIKAAPTFEETQPAVVGEPGFVPDTAAYGGGGVGRFDAVEHAKIAAPSSRQDPI